MAHFDVNPSNTTGVVLSAANGSDRARFLFLGITNMTTTAVTVTVYDGPDASATARIYVSLPAMSSIKFDDKAAGINSVVPKTWWTAGNAIWVACSASLSVRVYGEIVREP